MSNLPTLVRQPDGARREIVRLSAHHEEVYYINPEGVELMVNIFVKNGELIGRLWCAQQRKAIAYFAIENPTEKMLQLVAEKKADAERAIREKEEDRQRFINQEEYKYGY